MAPYSPVTQGLDFPSPAEMKRSDDQAPVFQSVRNCVHKAIALYRPCGGPPLHPETKRITYTSARTLMHGIRDRPMAPRQASFDRSLDLRAVVSA
jgi:hypothetical protein